MQNDIAVEQPAMSDYDNEQRAVDDQQEAIGLDG